MSTLSLRLFCISIPIHSVIVISSLFSFSFPHISPTFYPLWPQSPPFTVLPSTTHFTSSYHWALRISPVAHRNMQLLVSILIILTQRNIRQLKDLHIVDTCTTPLPFSHHYRPDNQHPRAIHSSPFRASLVPFLYRSAVFEKSRVSFFPFRQLH